MTITLTPPSQFAADVLAGLKPSHANGKSLSPKYFYDKFGSRLFDKICALPEYYVTRTELGILSDNAREIASCMGSKVDLIEFGAGSLTKVRLILDAFLPRDLPRRLLPIDISGDHLMNAVRRLRPDYPGIVVEPLIADYMTLSTLPLHSGRPVGFFPGSTIGNLEIDDAARFLRRTARLLQGGGLLIGVDLVKPPDILHAAYNDQAGITAEFNLNLLRRINRELDANFDLNAFTHYALYDPAQRRVEMHLISRTAQNVQVLGQSVDFEEGEAIHTENSHKFTITGFQALASEAGFIPKKVWTDQENLFSVHWLQAPH